MVLIPVPVGLLGLMILIILGLFGMLRYVVVNLYMHVRTDRDLLTRNRDEWRAVAERALFMATVNQVLAERATALAFHTPAAVTPPVEVTPP